MQTADGFGGTNQEEKAVKKFIGAVIASILLALAIGINSGPAPSSVNWGKANVMTAASVNWGAADSVNWGRADSVNWGAPDSVNWG
jgi:hypothetical protein